MVEARTAIPIDVQRRARLAEALSRTVGRQIGIITLKDRTLSPLAKLFIECAREVIKPMATSQTLRSRGKRGNNSSRNS